MQQQTTMLTCGIVVDVSRVPFFSLIFPPTVVWYFVKLVPKSVWTIYIYTAQEVGGLFRVLRECCYFCAFFLGS